MKVKFSISLDKEIYDQVKILADKQGIGVSTLVNAVLQGGLDSTQQLVEALSGITVPRLISMLTEERRKQKKRK
jgi:hypothetical protein